jgi:hypothetical protein
MVGALRPKADAGPVIQGLEALCDRSRRPVRYANQLPDQVERLIVEAPSRSWLEMRVA